MPIGRMMCLKTKSTPPKIFLLLMAVWMTVFSHAATMPEEPIINYKGWKVLKVNLENDSPSPTNDRLFDMEEESFLEVLKIHEGTAEVAVSPQALVDLKDMQEKGEISFTVVIEDLGEKLSPPTTRETRAINQLISFDRYMTFNEICDYILALPKKYSDRVRTERIGSSVEGRPILAVRITSNINLNGKKKIIYVEAGIHAREWVSPASALYLIEQLINYPKLITETEWRIIPVLNPDGYVYSWTHDRLWRKNRSRVPNSSCIGTNLNRNFGYKWGVSGSSSNPCSRNYKGPSPFSEPESRALRTAMEPLKDRIKAYVSLHSYGQYILYPWSYSADDTHSRWFYMYYFGKRMASKIREEDGIEYEVSKSAKLYASAGDSGDWVAHQLDVPYVYTVELRDNGTLGFDLPPSLIRPTATDAWVALRYLGSIIQYYYK